MTRTRKMEKEVNEIKDEKKRRRKRIRGEEEIILNGNW